MREKKKKYKVKSGKITEKNLLYCKIGILLQDEGINAK
jgi:hypothetical protein